MDSELDTPANPVYSSRLDYFQNCVPTDVSVLSEEIISIHPTTPITSSNQNIITFDISSHQSAFLDLSASNLFLRCKVTKTDGGPLAAGDMVVYSNNLLSSLWQNVTIYMNNKVVYTADNLYAYRSMIEKLCTNDYENLDELFYKETSDGECVNANTDVTGRQTDTNLSTITEVSGPLYTDITRLPKYVPNGVSVQIKLERTPDKFCLLSNQDDTQYKIEILDIYYNIVRVNLFPQVLDHINSNFRSTKGTIPYQSISVKTLAVPTGSSFLTHDRIFCGRIPSKCIVGLVSATAFNGKLSKNPYNFQQFALSKINMSTDLDQSVSNFTSYNFAKNQMLEGFLNFTRVVGNSKKLLVNRNSWANGKTLHGFNLTPKLNPDSVSVARNGSVRLHLEFSGQTTETIIVVILAVYDNMLFIDEQRNISWE